MLVVETFVDPEQFNGTVYTAQDWGIENGTHQRLDVSLNDDPCRVRDTNGLSPNSVANDLKPL